MLRIHFTAEDLASVVISQAHALPVSEAVMSLQILRRRPTAFEAPWHRHVLERLPARAPLLGALVPASGWMPDFLTPSPYASPDAGAFEAIRSTGRARIASDLRRLTAGRRPAPWMARLAEGEREAVDAVTDTMAEYYDVAIAPFATGIRALIDADRARRMRTMTRAGVGAVLAELHPQVRWRRPVLEVPFDEDRDFHLAGRGLLLCAHVFCGPRPRALLNDTDTPTLVYPPAREPHTILTLTPAGTAGPEGPAALTALLGRTRTAVLWALADPAGHTTGRLAARLGISAASASEHAGVLRAAGLITSTRHANTVRHTATPLGLSLLAEGGGAL